MIELRRRNDQISINGALEFPFACEAAQGDTELDVNGDGMVDGNFTPGDATTTVPGLGATLGATIQVPSLMTKITASRIDECLDRVRHQVQ